MARGEPCLERGLWDTGCPPRVVSLARARGALPGRSTLSSASRGIIEKESEISSERAGAENPRGPLREATRGSEQTGLGVRGPRVEETLHLVDGEDIVAEGECSNLATGWTWDAVFGSRETEASKNSSKRAAAGREECATEGGTSNLAGEAVLAVSGSNSACAALAEISEDVLERDECEVIWDNLRVVENYVAGKEGSRKTEQEVQRVTGDAKEFGQSNKPGKAKVVGSGRVEGGASYWQLQLTKMSKNQKRKLKKRMALAAGGSALAEAEQKKRKLEEVTPNCQTGNGDAKRLKTGSIGKKVPIQSGPQVSKKKLKQLKRKLQAGKPQEFPNTTAKFGSGGNTGASVAGRVTKGGTGGSNKETKVVGAKPPVTGGKKRKIKGGKPRDITETFVKFISGGVTGGNAHVSLAGKVDKYGTIDSGQGAEVEDKMIGSTTLAVVPVGFPRVEMTKKQADLVEAALVKCIIHSGEQEPVQFSATLYRGGGLAVTCVNRATEEWLYETVPKIIPWPGARLLVGRSELLLKFTELVLSLPKALQTISDGQILELLQKQNKGISTAKWKALGRVAEGEKTERLTIWVDEKSFHELKGCDFKLFFGLNRAYLWLQSEWNNLPAGSSSTDRCDPQLVTWDPPPPLVDYRPRRTKMTDLVYRDLPLPRVRGAEQQAMHHSLAPTLSGLESCLLDSGFEGQSRTRCRKPGSAFADSPDFHKEDFTVSDRLTPQEHMCTESPVLQNAASRFLASEQPCNTSEWSQETIYLEPDQALSREATYASDQSRESQYFTSDCQQSRGTSFRNPSSTSLQVTILTASGQLSTRDNMHMVSDQLSTWGEKCAASDWQSVQHEKRVASDRLSPLYGRRVASDWLSRNERRVASDWLSPRNERRVASDRLSPRNERLVASDRLSPRNVGLVASDRLSPRNVGLVASDRLSPRNERRVASDRLSPHDKNYVATDQLSSCNSRHTVLNCTSPRNWYSVSNRALSSSSGNVALSRGESPNSSFGGSDRFLSDLCRSRNLNESLFQESRSRGPNQVQYEEDAFVKSRLKISGHSKIRELANTVPRRPRPREDRFLSSDFHLQDSRSSCTTSTHSRFRSLKLADRHSRHSK